MNEFSKERFRKGRRMKLFFAPTNCIVFIIKRLEYYTPVERGFEREIKRRLEYWSNLREKKQ